MTSCLGIWGPHSFSVSPNLRTGSLLEDSPDLLAFFFSISPWTCIFFLGGQRLSDLGYFLGFQCVPMQRGLQIVNLAPSPTVQRQDQDRIQELRPQKPVKLCYGRQASTGSILGVPGIPADKESPLKSLKGLPRRQSGWKV